MQALPFASNMDETSDKLVQLESLWGRSSRRLIPDLTRMAALLFAAEQYAESESYYWRLLEIQHLTMGDENIESARTLDALGNIYFVQELYVTAAQLYQMSLVILENCHAQKEPIFETVLCQLLWALRLQNSAEAKQVEKRLAQHRNGQSRSVVAEAISFRPSLCQRGNRAQNEAKSA